MSDANSCAIELQNLMERHEPDFLIDSLKRSLGERLPIRQGSDDGAMLFADTHPLFLESASSHSELRELMATNTPVT